MSWYSSDDDGKDIIVTQDDYHDDGGDVIIPHETVLLSIEEMKNKRDKLDHICAQLRNMLDSNLDVEHKELNKDKEYLQNWLQDEC